MFISWFKQRKNLIVLFYFVTIALISFNLIITCVHSIIKINDRPEKVREFVGGSVDISYGKYMILDLIRKVSLTSSFIFMWISSALLINNYKDHPKRTIVLFIIISMPLAYFLSIQFSPILSYTLLFNYLNVDPILVSILLTLSQSIGQPIAGLIFVILFWNISRIISYERDLGIFMIIAGIGFLLLFSANQASVLSLTPYPPFGVATITIIPIGAFLIMFGIYISATLISENINLRSSIYKITKESKLLHLIGEAEWNKEIQKTVNTIMIDKDLLRKNPETHLELELDEKELKKYIDRIAKEMKKTIS
jgi:hypothetical protein